MYNIRVATRRLTLLAMMLAMITALSALEHMLPPIPLLPPNVRLGLSNIVTMYALFFLGKQSAFALALLKSIFVLLTRGATAGLLSLCGGLFSLFCMIAAAAIFGDRISYLILSVLGAIAHNIGQIVTASLLTGTNLLTFYLPILIISGIVMGCVTGTLLRVVMPLFRGITNIPPTGRRV